MTVSSTARFVLHKGAYLRRPANVLDFFLVVSSFLLAVRKQRSLAHRHPSLLF